MTQDSNPRAGLCFPANVLDIGDPTFLSHLRRSGLWWACVALGGGGGPSEAFPAFGKEILTKPPASDSWGPALSKSGCAPNLLLFSKSPAFFRGSKLKPEPARGYKGCLGAIARGRIGRERNVFGWGEACRTLSPLKPNYFVPDYIRIQKNDLCTVFCH